MKTLTTLNTFYVGALLLAGLTIATHGQVVSTAASPTATAAIPAARETPWSITSREAHSRTWEKTVWEPDPSGNLVPRTRQYVELASGLHFRNPTTGQWEESREEWELLPGKAVARRGQHKASLNYSLNSAGAVELETPGGQVLRSHPLCLSYFDSASGQSVRIADVKDCVGKVSGNQVIYEDAFTDVRADVRYTYTKAGFEQDIILRERPPGPEVYGLNPATTRLQVLTEFVQAPTPAKRVRTLTRADGQAMVDETLFFGAAYLGRGRAFCLGQEEAPRKIAVGKQWLTLEGRTCLVEEAAVSDLERELEQLPASGSASVGPGPGSVRHTVSTRRLLPERKVARASQGQMQLASLTPSGPGLVLD
jgi:hypothetical protein